MKNFWKLTMRALLVACLTSIAMANATAQRHANDKDRTATDTNESANARRTLDDPNATKPNDLSVDEKLRRMEELIERQQQDIKELRSLIEKLSTKDASVAPTPADAGVKMPAADEGTSGQQATQPPKKEAAVPDNIKFAGDIRFRMESFRNQGFDNPVEVASRNRLRVRARLDITGKFNSEFDWGLRLATGTFTDTISTNQTLTDFYERKPFSLDRAFVRYRWKTCHGEGERDKECKDQKEKDPHRKTWGLDLTGGKFDPTFRRTQMVFDDDINVEGASEALYFERTYGKLYGIRLVAVQLPFNEVTADKDGVLYGGQVQTDWKFDSENRADVNAGYFAWNHADQVLFALGAATTQVNGGISNGAAVTGAQNGVLGTTNRLIRDANGNPIGFLANFNIFDVLANYVWQPRDKIRVRFSFDYVHNLSRRINDENNGYSAGIGFHHTKKCDWSKGRWTQGTENCDELRYQHDWLIGYIFARIEQDAVLVPFNFSDILASNSRVQIPTFAYVPTERVVLQWTGLFSQRANKIFLLSPVNRWINRMQFDVIYKF